MAKKCGKCDPHEICEECPEWIFTLADLIMCMMGLFVILWVLKPGGAASDSASAEQNDDMITVVAAIREAFGYVPNPNSNDPVDLKILMKRYDALRAPRGDLDQGRSRERPDGAEGTDPEVTTIRHGRQTTVGGRVVFEAGSSELSPDALVALDDVADQVRGFRNIIMIRGHTALDDLSDAATPAQRMDLSVRRAKAVADYLTSKGVEPEVMGCSTFEPVVQRAYNPEAQMLNRRVEVDSTTTLVTDLQEKTRAMPASPAQPASPTGSEAGHGDASHGSGHDAGHDAGH